MSAGPGAGGGAANLFLRSLAFNVAFYVWTTVILIVGLPLLLLPPSAATRFIVFWVDSSLWLLRTLCRLDYAIGGRENLPDGPVLVAAKHQSMWDTMILFALLRRPTYVVKRELGWIPIFGWFLRHQGMIVIDRRAGSHAMRRLLAGARATVAAGRAVIIFPEGTRTPPGSRRPYRAGIAGLYDRLGVPVVPVALNSGLYWGRRAFLKRPGTIRLEFLPPIPAGLSRRDFLARLAGDIETTSERLFVEARNPADHAPVSCG
ncbi:MAG: lysophospholipid acyltransferase family protein [Alphaproteobacteria bacterium]